MIEKLQKVTAVVDVPLSDHPMLSHLRGSKEVEHWDLSKLPEKINEVIEAVNQIQETIRQMEAGTWYVRCGFVDPSGVECLRRKGHPGFHEERYDDDWRHRS